MTQENKDELYREEFCSAYCFSEELLKYQLHTNTLVVEKYKGYIAGRKKGDEEIEEVRGYNISLANENRKLQEQCELLIESAECRGDEDCDHCLAIQTCKPCQVERDIIESLKKEIEELRRANGRK